MVRPLTKRHRRAHAIEAHGGRSRVAFPPSGVRGRLRAGSYIGISWPAKARRGARALPRGSVRLMQATQFIELPWHRQVHLGRDWSQCDAGSDYGPLNSVRGGRIDQKGRPKTKTGAVHQVGGVVDRVIGCRASSSGFGESISWSRASTSVCRAPGAGFR